jgi:hypothetical protein
MELSLSANAAPNWLFNPGALTIGLNSCQGSDTLVTLSAMLREYKKTLPLPKFRTAPTEKKEKATGGKRWNKQPWSSQPKRTKLRAHSHIAMQT